MALLSPSFLVIVMNHSLGLVTNIFILHEFVDFVLSSKMSTYVELIVMRYVVKNIATYLDILLFYNFIIIPSYFSIISKVPKF